MNLRFAGFGGQGIVLAGVIYGRAAIIDGKNAIQTQAYGSASRGGASKSDVIVQEEEIYELEFEDIDVLVAMAQEAYEKYSPLLKKDGILIVDKDLVKITQKRGYKIYKIPATRIASNKFGKNIIANMIMLGVISVIVPIVSRDAIKQAISELVPEKMIDKNIQAFEEGTKLISSPQG